MNKKLVLALGVVIIVVAAFVAYTFWPSPEPTVTVKDVYDVTEPGMTFLVKIMVENVKELKLWAINLEWDASKIAITTGDPNGLTPRHDGKDPYNLYEGPFLKSVRETLFQVKNIDAENGKLIQLYCGFETLGETASGSGVLATINFTCISVGTTRINITGPSPAYPGHSFLEDSIGKEIHHIDNNGTIAETAP